MNDHGALAPRIDSVRRKALAAGVVAALLCALGAFFDPAQFLRSWLWALVFWLSFALGSLALLMLHHLTSGDWGFLSQRVLEAAAWTAPFLALLLIPVFFGMQLIYPWARPDLVASDGALQHKQGYLNLPFFFVRYVVYVAIWAFLALRLWKWSAELDRTGDPAFERRMQRLSGPGLVLYVLTVTFAAVDWVMSLEPHWFSSMYGPIYVVGQGLSALGFAIIALMLLARYRPVSAAATSKAFLDLGNLLLAFVILWAYVQFSQFLIIWSGNLPREILWYKRRFEGGWGAIAIALLLLHFFVPFFFLLMRQTKQRMRALAGVAILILAMRLVDHYWLVSPAFHHAGFAIHWLDFATPVAIGGVWMALFLWRLRDRPLLPVHDPRPVETLEGAR